MKILQVLTELGAGGAERVVLELSEELVRRGGVYARMNRIQNSAIA